MHRFTPFNDAVLTDLPVIEDANELNTIVMLAREDGFNEEFLKHNRWYAICISGAILEKNKYIAAYQVAPVSGITHIAEVESIDKYEDTNKYIFYFKPNSIIEINKIGLGKKRAKLLRLRDIHLMNLFQRRKTWMICGNKF